MTEVNTGIWVLFIPGVVQPRKQGAENYRPLLLMWAGGFEWLSANNSISRLDLWFSLQSVKCKAKLTLASFLFNFLNKWTLAPAPVQGEGKK